MKFKLTIFILLTTFLQSCIETQSSKSQNPITKPAATEQPVTITSESQVISLLGTLLPEKQLSERVYNERMSKMEEARTAYENDPENIDKIIWYGRRLAYLGRYKEAIHIYSVGLDLEANNYELLRHRGHRYITLREFDKAIEDLQRAAFYVRPAETVIEPDGLPNRLNKPRTNNKFNIWYHLGIAYYLKGNYDKAISAFKKCLDFADNDDLLVANTDWFYMTYQKIGNKTAAKDLLTAIHRNMNIIENYSYHELLLMYKGENLPEDLIDRAERENGSLDPTLAYGIANWYLYNGQLEQAQNILNSIISHHQWDAFGYIAAEVDKRSIENL